MRIALKRTVLLGLCGLIVLAAGCGGNASFFNPSFINFLSGGVYPLTPGPRGDFVMVRTVNETNNAVRFFVTIERTKLVLDDQGLPQEDEQGGFVTENVLENVELTTGPTGQGSELGVLFPCSDSPVIRVGLGRSLLPADPAVFIISAIEYDPEDPFGPQAGFGVTAEELNPLDLERGSFNCGDTIIFRAITSTGRPGEVKLETFLLPGSEQPDIFSGPNTFVNFQAFLESQVREEELP